MLLLSKIHEWSSHNYDRTETFNTLNGPELIERLHFRISLPNSRNKSLFYLPNITKYDMNLSPSYILIFTTNSINDFDVFLSSLNELIKLF